MNSIDLLQEIADGFEAALLPLLAGDDIKQKIAQVKAQRNYKKQESDNKDNSPANEIINAY